MTHDNEYHKAYESGARKYPIFSKLLLVIFGFWQVADLVDLAVGSGGNIRHAHPAISAIIDCYLLTMVVYAIIKE
jgi:hypothetical protein